MHLKRKALEFGADIVGICEIEPSDVYRGKTVMEKYAIAVGQRMLWRAFQVVPSQESAIEFASQLVLASWFSSCVIASW